MISLKHQFESAVPDLGSPDEVGPDEWNAEHVLSQATGRLLGRVTSGDGATEELTPTQAKALLDIAIADVADLSDELAGAVRHDGAQSLDAGEQAQARANVGLETTSTDNAIVRFDSTAGATQDSGVTIDDDGVVAGAKVLPTGASTARTLAARFADVFNVKDYGAVGDNSTDDGPAIQSAIDAALASAFGGVVYFPAPSAKYNVNTQLDCPLTAGKNIIFRGDGYGSIVQAQPGFTTPIFYVNGPSSIGSCGYQWEDLGIWGQSGANYVGVEMEFGSGASFKNVDFVFLDTAVLSADGYAVKFLDGCRWRTIRSYGFRSTTACHHTTFDNIAAYNTGTAGTGAFCKIDAASDNIVCVHSAFETGTKGFDLAGGTSFTFCSNYFEFFTGDPIVSSALLYSPNISDNWISLGAAWEIANVTRGQFVRNSVYNQTITFSATTFTEMYVAQNRPWGTGSVPASAVQRWVGSGTETTKFLSARTIGVQNITAGASIVANMQIGAFGFYNLSSVAVCGITAHYTNNADGATSYMSFRTGNVDDQAVLDASGNYSGKGSATFLNATAVPAGGTAGVGVKLSSTANFGIFFGSGLPTLAAAQGSLYLRTDGSSTSTRMYVNTDGGTTWTAVTTAA